MDRKTNILVVDDMSTHLLLLQSILEDDNEYVISIIDEPAKVVDTMIKKETHILLLDIMMPGMDGYKVLSNVKSNPQTRDVPVIIISAKTDSWSIKNAMDLGAFDYLTKPINIHDVKNKVRAAVDSIR